MINENKILVVEDENDSRFLFERLLTKNGYTVQTAENGEVALSTIKEFNPKVILADWTMPKINGVELCNIIKKKEEVWMILFPILCHFFLHFLMWGNERYRIQIDAFIIILGCYGIKLTLDSLKSVIVFQNCTRVKVGIKK